MSAAARGAGPAAARFLVAGLAGLWASAAGAHPLALDVEQALARPPAAAETAAPTAEQDIAALVRFGLQAKLAGLRLAERGEEVLSRLHEALLAPGASPQQRIQLAAVLAELGDAVSVAPLVELGTRRPPELFVRRSILQALTDLPQTPASFELARRVLEDPGEDPLVRRTALVYFATHRDPRAAAWVEAFAGHAEAELRGGALVLAAFLGRRDAIQPIVGLMQNGAPRSLRDGLLIALAELTAPDEFERLAPAELAPTPEYASALRYARFRAANAEGRLALCREMIGADSAFERKAAARFLLAQRGPDALEEYVQAGVPLHVRAVARHELRQAGFRVVQRGDRALVERRVPR